MAKNSKQDLSEVSEVKSKSFVEVKLDIACRSFLGILQNIKILKISC